MHDFAVQATKACALFQVEQRRIAKQSHGIVIPLRGDPNVAADLRSDVQARARELAALRRLAPPGRSATSFARYIGAARELNRLEQRLRRLNAQASTTDGASNALAAEIEVVGHVRAAQNEQRRLARLLGLAACERAAG